MDFVHLVASSLILLGPVVCVETGTAGVSQVSYLTSSGLSSHTLNEFLVCFCFLDLFAVVRLEVLPGCLRHVEGLLGVSHLELPLLDGAKVRDVKKTRSMG